MRYLVSVIDDGVGLATPAEMAAIDAFNDRLMAEGYWVFAGGLGAPDTATVIDNRGGEALFSDSKGRMGKIRTLVSRRPHRAAATLSTPQELEEVAA